MASELKSLTPSANDASCIHVELKDLPAMRLAAVPHRGPYNQIGPAFRSLAAIAGPAGWFGRTGAKMMGVFHDDCAKVPAAELRSDAALTVSEDEALPPGVEERRIPGGRYACFVHQGPYEALAEAWDKFSRQWLPNSGHITGSAPSLEIYHNTPMDTKPEDLRTELCVAVQP